MKAPAIALDELVEIIVAGYGPVEKTILFGSAARGEQDQFSDVDLIIIKRTSQRFLERLLAVPLLPIRSDVFVYTPQEFAQMRSPAGCRGGLSAQLNEERTAKCRTVATASRV